MFKLNLILRSFLLFLFLEIAYSSTFNIVTNNNEFKPSTELRGYYVQKTGRNQINGYHQAEVYFKTRVPSLNPDQTGVKSIDCNDGNKITLSMNDKNAIEKVNDWPEEVMLMVSHKWKCFDEKTTQFFMTKNKVIDPLNNKVTFTTERCKVSDWSSDFVIDLSWVDGKDKSIRNNRHRLNRRVPLPKIDKSSKLNLNVLFDEATGSSSKPDLTLASSPNLSLFCANCFMKGEATINVKLSGSFSLSKAEVVLKDAELSLNGNALMNLELSVNGTIDKTFTFENDLFTVPLSGFPNVPGLFTIGPSIKLVVAAELSANIKGSIGFGGEVSLPDFNANVNFVNISQPSFQQSGFKPKSKLFKPKFGISASANIIGSIKPQLTFGIDVLDGKFSKELGFEIVGNLENNVSIGTNTSCLEKSQLRLKTNLDGNLGFFLDDDGFPIVEFPSVTLLDQCF